MLRLHFEEHALLYPSPVQSSGIDSREVMSKGGFNGFTKQGRVDDRDLETEGDAERTGGKVQEGFGKARRKVGEAIEDIGESVRK